MSDPMTRETYCSFLLTMRDQAATYHHHKEQIAFTAAIVYISAAIAFAANMYEVVKVAGNLVAGAMAAVLTVVSYLFIGWQLVNRWNAHKRVEEVDRILEELVMHSPKDFDRDLVEDSRKIFAFKTASPNAGRWAEVCGTLVVAVAVVCSTVLAVIVFCDY